VAPPDAIWNRARAIGRQLAAWATASIVAGAALILAGGPFGGAVGVQFVVWGAVDLAIAALGERDRRRKLGRGARDDPRAGAAEARRLRRLLWINAGLDVVYLAVGGGLVAFGRGPVLDGHGVGVLVQGGFLLIFDAAHAATLPRSDARR
jgi:hypothetical protein